MKSQSNCLSLEVRCFIVFQVQQGVKYDDIIENIRENFDENIVKGTISKLYQKYITDGSLEDRPISGRPPARSMEEEKELVQAVEENRKLNAVMISNDPKLNPHGFSSRWISET